MKNLDKQFVSDIDQKLAEFDKAHPKSKSQLAEIHKYQAIYQLRDIPTPQAKKDGTLWD